MALTNEERAQLIEDALRWHTPWRGEGADTRTRSALRVEFLKRHLPGLVAAYQDYRASVGRDTITSGDV